MNVNYKLRARQQGQESGSRRIKTDVNENSKKISFYLGRPTKQPLQQNKRVLNQTQTVQQKVTYSQITRQKPVKSIGSKNIGISKLTTEPFQKPNVINRCQKQAIDQLFGPDKDNKRLSELYLKKNVLRQKQRNVIKQVRVEPVLQGIARYSFQGKVGAGTFGIVHKARDKKTLEIVAIKKVYQDKKYKNRELQILKTLNHPNTLQMRDCFYTYEADKQYLNVVMDYFDLNLYEYVQRYKLKAQQISSLKVKVLAFQLFRSLLYLNKISIAHRDIKPQNILVNDSNLKLVMCDFGSAKQLKHGELNIAYICSRCYRAPQLIFGNTSYTTQIDMWSAGCVLVEMITMEPIFRAQSNIDQLVQIIKILGTPSYSEMLEMNSQCDFTKYQLPKIGPKNWEKVIKRKNMGDQFVDLLKKVLRYSPLKRLTPFEALTHPFFDEIKSQQTYCKLKRQYNIPNLFDFNETKQVDGQKIKYIVPKWYKH